MKNLLLSVVIGLTNYLSIYCQIDSINCTDIYGNRQGKWIIEKDRYTYVVNFVNDTLQGKMYKYSKNHLIEESNYVNGKLNGTVIEFYKDGDTAKLYTYKNDTLNGIYNSYYKNKIYVQANYKNGLIHGKEYYYFKNGNIKNIYYYEEGRMVANYEAYYRNGILKEHRIKKSDTVFFRNSKIKCIENSDFRIYMNKKGDTLYLENYHIVKSEGNDTLVSNTNKKEEFSRSKKNKYKKVEPFFNGKKDGMTKIYYPDGKIYIERYFENDIYKYSNIYYKNGKIKSNTEVINKVYITKYYKRNGEYKKTSYFDTKIFEPSFNQIY